MSEHKKRLAELFGLVKLDLDDAADTSRVKRKGKDADESALLGRQAFLEGDYASGIERFEEALAQDETPTPAREMDLAAAYEFVERSEEAEAIYGKLTENEAESAEARLALAEMSRRNSKFSEAIDQVERAIAKEPNSPLFHFKRAEMCRDAKLYRDALRSAERAAP